MNNKQHAFVTEYLRHGDKIIAYNLAYKKQTNNYTAIESAANRLLRDPEIAHAISSVRDAIRHEVEQEIRQQLRTELLSIQRKRELLAQIATGELCAIQVYKGKDCNQCTQMVRPTINQMLKAIDLDNKLAGHYTVSSKQLTVNNSPALHKQVDEFTGQFTVDNSQLANDQESPTAQEEEKAPEFIPAGGIGVQQKEQVPLRPMRPLKTNTTNELIHNKTQQNEHTYALSGIRKALEKMR